MPAQSSRALLLATALAVPSTTFAQRDSVLTPMSLQGGAPAALAVEPGPKPFLTLLCKYADQQDVEPGSRAQFERNYTANEYPSVAHYWAEVADGRFSLEGSKVYGWYVLPRPTRDYVSTFSVNFPLLEQDCMDAADADVNFPDFHGINFVVNANLDGKYYAGGFPATRDGVTKNYVATYLGGSAAYLLGHAAHEIGHTFGLPHTSGAYGATYDSKWDVMSVPSWFKVPGTEIYAPVHTNADQKLRLGVIAPERQAVAGVGISTFLLDRHARPPANANPLVVTIPIPGPSLKVPGYYTLEVRGGPGAGYDAAFPEPAVVIHRFMNFEGLLVTDVDGNGDPNDEGARWTVGEIFVDRINDIRVSIDAIEGSAFRLTVTVADRATIAVAPTGNGRRVAADQLGPRVDSAFISFAGPGTSELAWTASAGGRSRRLAVNSATLTGAGAGWVRWTDDPSALGPGIYPDTIYVNAPGLANGPGLVLDTLVVTAATTATTMGLAASSGADSLITGLAGTQTRTLQVRPSGADATTAAWTVAKKAAWIQNLSAGASVGTSTISWRHDATDLAPGTYVDTLVVSLSAALPGAPGSTARFIDTLRVVPPLTLALERRFGAATFKQAAAAALDSIYVTLSGAWAAGAVLNTDFVFGANVFLRVPRPKPGSGWIYMVRTPGTLAPGTYVNRVRVALSADTSVNEYYEDTLHVVAAPPRIVLTKYSGRDTLENGSWQSMDSVFVQPEGEGGPNRKWETRAKYENTNLQQRNGSLPFGSGPGPGWLVWMRNTSGRGPGVYVDTLVVKFASGPGDSAVFVDSLVVTGVPALAITSDTVRPGGVMGAAYADTLRAEGGEGGWEWTVTDGVLPAGVALAPSGRVAGIPEETGVFRFTAKVTSGTRALVRQFRVDVTAPTLVETAVFDRLLGPAGGASLTESELRYLDLQGNRNGRFDVGDARAWRARQAAALRRAASEVKP